MVNPSHFTRSALPSSIPIATTIQVLPSNAGKRCHVVVPDLPKPVGAIVYENKYYSYFRYYGDTEAVQRAAARLIARGDQILLTRARSGLVLWVFEPEAQPVASFKH